MKVDIDDIKVRLSELAIVSNTVLILDEKNSVYSTLSIVERTLTNIIAELDNTTVTELLYEELETGELVETNEPNIKAPCNLAEAERYYIDCLARAIAETQDMAEKSRLTAKLTNLCRR